MGGFKTVGVDMGIDLGRGYIGMSQHHLDRAQIGATRQEMGGKGMAQDMRADLFVDTSGQGYFPNNLPETISGHARATIGNEQQWTRFVFQNQWAAPFNIIFNMSPGSFRKRNDSFFVAFAEDAEMAAVEIAAVNRQVDQFRNTQS